jgi:pentatricopeptide repeat protein
MTAKPQVRRGVIGLLADLQKGRAFVTPLVTEVASDWVVAPNLPFRATELQCALQRVLSSSRLTAVLPDFFAFRVADCLGQKSYGSSMLIAGLLAIVDAATDFRNPLLGTAVAVVEPAKRDGLRPVEHITQKLLAFEREVGTGTLLVRGKYCPEAKAFDHRFQTVWTVDCWDELAQKLGQHGLLAVFHQQSPLDRQKLRVAIERLSVLCSKHSRYREALELAEELAARPVGSDVTTSDLQDLRQFTIDLYRHLGRYRDARQHAREEWKRLRSAGVATSYDQQARSAAVFAASQYDLHCFDDMCRVLGPWHQRLNRHPLIVAPITRVMVYNTLARAQVALNSPGWEPLYHDSLSILSQIDPFDLPRTYNYLLHGLLRGGRLDEAAEILNSAQSLPNKSGFSKWMLGFCRAELARRRGEIWSDVDLDALSQSNEVTGHALGFYLQATARQPGRSVGDATRRFQRARQIFLRDVVSEDVHNILVFLADCMTLALAAWNADVTSWRESVAALRQYIGRQPFGGFTKYYRSFLPHTLSDPSVEAAEAMLIRVPFF